MTRWAALAIAVLINVPAHAGTHVVVWGIESWSCGEKWYKIRLGDGHDVRLKSMQGSVSASQSQIADVTSSTIRQSLTSIFAQASLFHSDHGSVVSSPDDGRTNHELGDHLAEINVKQSAFNQVHFPVSYNFDDGVVIPEGELTAMVFTESYANYPVRKMQDNPAECLNTEIHLTVQFEDVVTLDAKLREASPP